MKIKSFDKTIKLFENKYLLTNDEKEDLKYRLKTKSYYLYKLAIEFLEKNNIKANYQNVSNLIKLEIKIRNDVRNLITAFEEAIYNKYISYLEEKNLNINLKEISKIQLNKIINEKLKIPILNKIRHIRNDVSHITYFIIYEKIEDLISDLKEIKNIDFINEKNINILISKIKNEKNKLGFKKLKF